MPPIVVALADSVQKDRALERLVRSVSTSSATKRDRQRFHDAADQAADSLDIEAQPESEADNADKRVAEYSGQRITSTVSVGGYRVQGISTAAASRSTILAIKALSVLLAGGREDKDTAVNQLAAEAQSQLRFKELMNHVAFGRPETKVVRDFRRRATHALKDLPGRPRRDGKMQ